MNNPSPTTMKECNCKKAELKGYISTNCPIHGQPSEEKECVCLDIKQPHPMCPIHVPKQDWEERLVDMMDGFYSDMAINKVKSFITQLLKDERGKVFKEGEKYMYWAENGGGYKDGFKKFLEELKDK